MEEHFGELFFVCEERGKYRVMEDYFPVDLDILTCCAVPLLLVDDGGERVLVDEVGEAHQCWVVLVDDEVELLGVCCDNFLYYIYHEVGSKDLVELALDVVWVAFCA